MNIAKCCGLAVLIWAADVSMAEAQCAGATLQPDHFHDRRDSVYPDAQHHLRYIICMDRDHVDRLDHHYQRHRLRDRLGHVFRSQNTTGSPRTGTLTVGGQTVTVNQGTGGCTGTVTPLSFAVDAIASSRTVSVIAGTACSWTATTTTAWITVTAGASGSGIGSVTFSVAAEHDGTARTGTLTVAGQTVTVNQGATG